MKEIDITGWRMSNKRHTRIGPHVAPNGKFTGLTGSDSKKKQKSTRKERRKNRGTHVNKYPKPEIASDRKKDRP